MVERDPIKTARNKRIEGMKAELRKLLPQVLFDTSIESEQSLNGKIGAKIDDFIDLKNEVIESPEQFLSLYLTEFEKVIKEAQYSNRYTEMYRILNSSKCAQEYFGIFLQRSYLKHYDSLAKVRPTVERSEMWIGQNDADYGLLITPRFAHGDWENDKSEIRHFKPKYFSIGHVLQTGFVVPGKNDCITFKDVNGYLSFFENTLVRQSKSPYQKEIAAKYSAYVRSHANPLEVPLLIPELRYNGRQRDHEYRLDFCVINADNMQQIGFELSPYSTHGKLTGTGKKTQKEINQEAKAVYDKEFAKHKRYFQKHGIFVLTYTDQDLQDLDNVFEQIKSNLEHRVVMKQLNFHLLSNFFDPK